MDRSSQLPSAQHGQDWSPVAPGIWRLRLGVPEEATPVSILKPRPAIDALGRLPAALVAPMAAESIDFRRSGRGCSATLPLAASEHVFGMGLQLKSNDQTTRKKVMRVNSDPVADTGDSHAPVPFYVSTRGYGVLVDTARYATFYCGSHAPASDPPPDVVPAGAAPPDNAEALYRRSKTPHGPMVVDVPVAQGVDLYLFAGPSLRQAVQRYVLFGGGGCLPPMWGLGVWYRAYINHHQDEAIALARELRERGIPCDVYGLEPGWHSHAYACSHRWHPERFPDPADLIHLLRTMGFQVNLWEHVFVDATSPLHGAISDASGDWRVWGGLIPDLNCPGAADAFADYHDREFVAKGIGGFKLDECDNSDYVAYPWSFPEHSRFPSGLDGEQMHSLLGVLYQRLIEGVFRRHNRRTLSQVRSSHALASPYPFVLYSDLYDHRDFIRGVVTAGYSGLLWSPEVRQCKSPEDLVRRVQSVVFSAQALVNGWMVRNPPWQQVEREKNNRHAFMDDWQDTEARCRELFRWRMRLLPYLYSSFARYRFEGLPPFRSMAMDWPDEPEAWLADDQYMMGDHLLVAPVVAGQTERDVYLPPGTWYDLWSNARVVGGDRHRVDAPLEQIPVFVREGAILPLAEPVDSVRPNTVFDLTVTTYGSGRCDPFVLFEDDGESYNYERGEHGELVLSWDPARGPDARRSGNASAERYRVQRWRHVRGDQHTPSDSSA